MAARVFIVALPPFPVLDHSSKLAAIQKIRAAVVHHGKRDARLGPKSSPCGMALAAMPHCAVQRDGLPVPGEGDGAVVDGSCGGGAPPVAAAPAEFLCAPLIAAPEPRLPSGLPAAGVSLAPGGRGLWVGGAGCAAVPAFPIPEDCFWASFIAAPDCRLPSVLPPEDPCGACAKLRDGTMRSEESRAKPVAVVFMCVLLFIGKRFRALLAISR
jgi:hypothetical protein